MANVSVSLPADGSTGTVSQYNTPITSIVNTINGGLDNTNIASGAAIATSKLADDTGITTAKLASASVTPSKLNLGPQTAIVAADQGSVGQGYADLATVGPAVTVTIGANGLALVILNANLYNDTSGFSSFMSFAVSGATTTAAADSVGYIKIRAAAANADGTAGGVFLVTGLTPGSTTFTAKYRGNGNTAHASDRRITVLPL